MRSSLTAALVMLGGVFAGPAVAFNGHRVASGPLTMVIEPVATVKLHEPVDVAVTLTSTAAAALPVRLELKGLVDESRAVGPTVREVSVPAGGQATAAFQVVFPEGCHSALYPVHVWADFAADGKKSQLHAIRIVTTEFPPKARTGAGEAAVVPERGGLALLKVRPARVLWNYLGKPVQELPGNWQGQEPKSLASLGQGTITRGETRGALIVHPPYRPGPGTIFVEYRLRLPKVPAGQPLRLTFFNAIRDHTDKEPPSDGVTFRVWVDDRKAFERHTDAKTWVPGEVDLAPFAGQEVRLRLESHPGPKNDTTCDSCYWGDPVIVSGRGPRTLSVEERKGLTARTLAAVASGIDSAEVYVIPLAGGRRAALSLGPNGLLDGVLAFGDGPAQVALDGLRAAVEGDALGRWPSAVLTDGVKAVRGADGRVTVTHRLHRAGEAFDLTVQAWAERDGLRLAVRCPRPISELSLGPADRTAGKVWFGHGYCVVEPGAFTQGGGGHSLAASHAAFDFDGGLSLLMATDTPPDAIRVDPARKLYTLAVHPEATFTFVPGRAGAVDCARRYRPLCEKKPGAGFAKKNGRFVFDWWGGRYADNARLLRDAFAYGLTDSLVVLHVWQRWGYDYRLPDIYPPDPRLGTVEEMQELARVCAEQGVPFALHDNYIDFYPDADDFSYEHITFHPDGTPRKAWLNEGRQAQSYQFRPDHIGPFVRRNLEPIAATLKPTASFVDVFTSANVFDYHDRQGKFHSKVETQRSWADCFETIRKSLGPGTVTISEAGGDYLVGPVDGADCQFLQLGPKGGHFVLTVPCRDWERVPWFDAVLHQRFSLHGVGYPGRYEGGRDRVGHGIESDDYLGSEVLTGHALMIDRGAGLRGAVRKYWLLQDVARGLAGDEVASVTHAGGDIHRVIVAWQSGAKTWVNRGTTDWEVEGKILPPYGFLARVGEVQASVERVGQEVVERSRGPGKFYGSGRGKEADLGPVATRGAVRCELKDGLVLITPLPDAGEFPVRIDVARMLGRPAAVAGVEAVDRAGRMLRAVPTAADGTGLRFTVAKGEFAYRVRVK